MTNHTKESIYRNGEECPYRLNSTPVWDVGELKFMCDQLDKNKIPWMIYPIKTKYSAGGITCLRDGFVLYRTQPNFI